ncbi:MAG: acetyl-CoA hydrolase/transferase C-terminal domain-containing protein [Acidimicrobiia bacterium]
MTTRVCTADEAAGLVRVRDEIGIPLGPGQPSAFLHALGERDDFEALVVHGALLIDLFPLFTRRGVKLRSGFFGPAERFLLDSGADIEFVPADFRRFSLVARRVHPRVMTTAATPPDADGFLNLSLHAGATVDEVHRAGVDPDRLLVVEANPNLPRTVGLPPAFPHTIHVDDVDVLVESDRDAFVLADAEPTDVDRAIAEHASAYIHDGCTIQTGIGGIPSMIARLLAEGPGGDYGVHSEMFTTGLMYLHEAGKVTNRKGTELDGFSVTTFAAGTRELYDWLDGNADVRFLPVDAVNTPNMIAANRDMVTINGALLVDLAGQVAADTIGPRQYSGIGGHEDFVAVSGFQLSDRALICLPSASEVDGVQLPRIVDRFPPGTSVTTPRHHVDVVVTEFGVAELAGRTVRERALALAGIAHPKFRDELTAAAHRDVS